MNNISKPWALCAFIWVGVIFFTSTSLAQRLAEESYNFFTGQGAVPHPEHGVQFLLVDKSFHVAIFCLLGLLLSRTVSHAPRRNSIVILLGAIVGSCSEYLQSFFPGRDPAIRDVFINIAGTALGVLLYSWFTLKRSGVPAASTNLRVPLPTRNDGR